MYELQFLVQRERERERLNECNMSRLVEKSTDNNSLPDKKKGITLFVVYV